MEKRVLVAYPCLECEVGSIFAVKNLKKINFIFIVRSVIHCGKLLKKAKVVFI